MENKRDPAPREHAVDDSEKLGGNSEQAESVSGESLDKGDNNEATDIVTEQEKDELENGAVKLSDSIMMYSEDPLCSSAHVYRGLLKSGIFGYQKIAVKYLQLNEENVKEANVLHDLGSHPNVVTLFHADVHRAGPFPAMYIAMERCQTLNLHDRIIQNKKDNVPFDPDMSLSQSKQVAVGVDFIHRKGIIYRDLKPQNILISEDGKSMKIADFGLSKPLKNGRSVTKQSMRGIGTDGYRAPETYNDDVITQSSDIYSLAFVFYFIWSYGCHPFGDDPDDWNRNIKKNRDRNLVQILIRDKEIARNLLEWMLQFLPKQRPNIEKVLAHPVFTNQPSSSIQESLILKKDPESPFKASELSGLRKTTRNQETTTSSDLTKVKQLSEDISQLDDMESLKSILEEEECQKLMNECKFAKALLKLKELMEQGRNELSTLLMIAECNLRLDRDVIAGKYIDDITQRMTSSGYRLLQVQVLIDETIKSSFHIRAMILLPHLSKLYKEESLPNDALSSINKCCSMMVDSVKAMSKDGGRSLIIAYNIGLPRVHEMLGHMRGINGVDDTTKVVREARCLNHVARCYRRLRETRKSLEFRFEGVQLMKQHFGEHANKYEIFGSLLHNIGTSFLYLKEYAEAESYYLQAIEAKDEALDYPNESERQRTLNYTMEHLEITHNKMAL